MNCEVYSYMQKRETSESKQSWPMRVKRHCNSPINGNDKNERESLGITNEAKRTLPLLLLLPKTMMTWCPSSPLLQQTMLLLLLHPRPPPFHTTVEFCIASLAMTRYNFRELRKEVSKAFATSEQVVNETYPQLFYNSETGVKGHASGAALQKAIIVDVPGQNGSGPLKRLSADSLRNFLLTELSIHDGYFWKWCIENDMIQWCVCYA